MYSPKQMGDKYGVTQEQLCGSKIEFCEILPKYSKEKIAFVLDYMRENVKWPPNCPEFSGIIKSIAINGATLSAREAYKIACHTDHEKWGEADLCVRYAARECGTYLLKSCEQSESFPEFEKHYNKALKIMFEEGEEALRVNEPKGITYDEGERVTPQQGKAARAEFLSLKSKLKLC